METAVRARDRARGSLSIRALLVSFFLLLASGLASLAGNLFILAEFPDRPRPRDALFEFLPYVSELRYVTAIALAAAFALFLCYALKHAPAEIPRFVAVFAIMYLLRAAIMVLTPLASAQGDEPFVFAFQQYGMFPSGHTGAALLLARLTDAERARRLRRAQTVLATAVALALVLAHGHYSIDVVGGLLLAYFVDQEWRHGRLLDPIKRLVAPQTNTVGSAPASPL